MVLSYTFSYNPVTQVATAVGTAAVDSLVIEPQSGSLEYSVNGGAFSGNWGGNTVPAPPRSRSTSRFPAAMVPRSNSAPRPARRVSCLQPSPSAHRPTRLTR